MWVSHRELWQICFLSVFACTSDVLDSSSGPYKKHKPQASIT